MEIKNEIQVEAIEKETREFICPCCQTKLQFRTRVSITAVGLADTRETKAARDGREVSLSTEEKEKQQIIKANRDFLAFAKESGVFDAFNQALDASIGNKPTNRDSYFLKWFQKAVKVNTPQFALRQCLLEKDLEAGGSLELWRSQGVSAVLQNNLFKVFIPNQLIEGEKVSVLSYVGGTVQKKEKENLEMWVRTRFGYVEKSSEFSNELRKRAVGSFQI